MRKKQILICTLGYSGSQTGKFLEGQHLKNCIILQFTNSQKINNEIVTDTDENFKRTFAYHIKRVKEPQNRIQALWQKVTKQTPIVDTIILIASLGGRYSSQVAPIAAQTACKCGYKNIIAILQMPFDFEGKRRTQAATTALENIKYYSNNEIIFDHKQLSKEYQSLFIEDYFNMIDNRILSEIKRQQANYL